MTRLTSFQWDEFLSHHPGAHLLQTGAWGDLKADFGWQVERLAEGDTGAQILFSRLPLGFHWAYLPKGPVGLSTSPALDSQKNFWGEVDRLCRRRRAIFLKVEPDLWDEPQGTSCLPPGFRPSLHSIQPPRTLVVDLSGDEESLLGRMKQKTRYNIRLAQKKGVVVQPSADLETFQKLMRVTGERDTFGVHSLEYYRKAYQLFHPRGECELLIAEYQGEPLAGLMVFGRGRRSWYLYGASSNQQRERMPTYLIQWEAMRWARARGCQEYDLWGVPDVPEEQLEAGFSERQNGLWGVYRFKRGFGGRLRRAAGPWDRVYLRAGYLVYQVWMKKKDAGTA